MKKNHCFIICVLSGWFMGCQHLTATQSHNTTKEIMSTYLQGIVKSDGINHQEAITLAKSQLIFTGEQNNFNIHSPTIYYEDNQFWGIKFTGKHKTFQEMLTDPYARILVDKITGHIFKEPADKKRNDPILLYSLEELIKEADFIIEGTLLASKPSSEQIIQEEVRLSKTSLRLNFGRIQNNIVKLSKIHKGAAPSDEILEILTHPSNAPLILNNQYILFLKKHPIQSRYTILNDPWGEWRIFHYNGITKVLQGNEYPALREMRAYQNYEDFISELNLKLGRL